MSTAQIDQAGQSTDHPRSVKWKRRHIISPGQYFQLHQGGQLRDLCDLHSALMTMDEEQFNHHVNGEQNDFADWLEAVFGEKAIADNIRLTRDREEIRRWVEECLYF